MVWGSRSEGEGETDYGDRVASWSSHALTGGGSSCEEKKQETGAGEESLSSQQLQEYDLAVIVDSHTPQYEAQYTCMLSE